MDTVLPYLIAIKGRTTYQHIVYKRTIEAEAAERKQTDLEMQQDIYDQTSTSTGCWVSYFSCSLSHTLNCLDG